MNVIIPYSEIHEILNGSYIDDGEETLTRSCLKIELAQNQTTAIR